MNVSILKKPIAIAGVVGALALGGTALAAGGGPLGGVLAGDDKTELAQDLAGELDGVNAAEVEQALDTVEEQRHAERTQAMAESIASNLDGVSTAQVAAALEKVESQLRESAEAGERPDRDAFPAALAEELGVSEEALTDALEAGREQFEKQRAAEMEERLDAAVEANEISQEQADQIRERIEDGGPGGPGGPHGGHGGPGGPGEPGFGPGGPGGPGFGPGEAPPAS